jgi:uncharacterized protein
MDPRSRELRIANGQVRLGGQLWLPANQPSAAVLMVPGSGPSDRHNDVFFPPIRSHLLANGIAVVAFDKRGVGGSTGDWLSAGIVEQAGDVLAVHETLSDAPELAGVPIGLFGHSQGGWVVLEAAGRGRGVAFVVTSSGPGVSPAEQERHAAADGLRRAGHLPAAVEAALTSYQSMLESIRAGAPYRDFQRALDAEAERRQFDHLMQVAFVPDSEGLWNFARLIIDYDPRPAMRRIRSPVLALFGAEDRSVPIERSVAVYRESLSDVAVHVFPEADHRCQLGDPPRMAPGYLDILAQEIRHYATKA